MGARYHSENPNHDFTLANYRNILRRIKETHATFSFRDAHAMGRDILSRGKFVIMRHDIEISARLALNLARIDADEGIHSTFFLLQTSEYNPFEENTARMIYEIIDLGHDIGLHYDGALFERLGCDPVAAAQAQANLFEAFFQTKIYAMSSHQPMRSQMTFSLPDVIDVYDSLYMQDIKYITDSSQVWREGIVSDLLTEYDRIHFLSHEFWSEEGHSWATLAALEAGEDFFEKKARAEDLIRRATDGLRLRREKDRQFTERYGLDKKS